METSQYFTLLVLAVCALHLISVTCKSIGNWWHTSQEKKRRIAKGSTLGKLQGKDTIQQRSDWYAFFHCSDLTGDSTKLYPHSSQLSNQAISGEKNAPQKNKPQGATRRPRASLNLS